MNIKERLTKDFEKRVFEWVAVNKYGLVLLVLASLVIRMFYFVPFINLALNSYLIFSILFFLGVFLLRVKSVTIIKLGIILFLSVFIYWILGEYQKAEGLTDYIYIILVAGVVKALFEISSSEK